MSDWDWGGARWWKWDLHTHTPASDDYGKGPHQSALKTRSPREWLLDHMVAGLDCVAVTDHNSGAWIDLLNAALGELDEHQPDGFRPLHLFPGVEISVSGGVHVLAIFARDKRTSDIDSLLGAVGFPPASKGSSSTVTSHSFPDVVQEIEAAGGIAIPAHVDCANGLFKVLSGTTLEQALACRQLFVMEFMDPSFEKPQVYEEHKCAWSRVLGSDSHHPSGDEDQRYPGSHFTWIKMGSPSIEGLRLALLDGSLSVRPSDVEPGDPNEHGSSVLESIEVADAHYMGQAAPFTVELNPWLNAIVGGRGTGKSTVVEFTRLALRREADLPDDLREEFEKYRRVYPDDGRTGLLRSHTRIQVVYRKNGSRFRLQWSPSGELDPIQEDVEGEWRRAEGEVRHRFPVRLFSQKQIFHLANKPRALLNVVDDAPEVDRTSWMHRVREGETQFLSLRAKAREIEAGLAEETGLRGELDDVKRKLALFEQEGHAEVLRALQRRRRQERAVEVWQERWANAGEDLRRLAEEIVPEALEDSGFDLESEPDAELHNAAGEARAGLEAIRGELGTLASQADQVRAQWSKAREEAAWRRTVEDAEAAYGELRGKLLAEGAGDPTAYGELVQRRQTIEQRLKELAGRQKQVQDLREQANERLERLLEMRRALTASRRDFLGSVLGANRFVRITVLPYQASESVEAELRERIQKEGEVFRTDIGSPEGGGLLGDLYGNDDPHDSGGDAQLIQNGLNSTDRFELGLERLKRSVHDIAAGMHDPAKLGDQRFAAHMRKLQPEALDRLDLWFPEDSLKVEYSPTGDGQRFRPIEEGSPGQKTAALLAFLLSYGGEPLVLDQPEDDLDNHLIYELIVTQLREVKRRRQIIVVTHNPNIVVNGDAELVVALASRGGETQKESEGSLQEKRVRDTICEVMEGGREAFDQRYRRIALEGRSVR